MKSIYEELGSTYQMYVDYEFIKLQLQPQKTSYWRVEIMTSTILKAKLFYNLLTTETLNEHIADVER